MAIAAAVAAAHAATAVDAAAVVRHNRIGQPFAVRHLFNDAMAIAFAAAGAAAVQDNLRGLPSRRNSSRGSITSNGCCVHVPVRLLCNDTTAISADAALAAVASTAVDAAAVVRHNRIGQPVTFRLLCNDTTAISAGAALAAAVVRHDCMEQPVIVGFLCNDAMAIAVAVAAAHAATAVDAAAVVRHNRIGQPFAVRHLFNGEIAIAFAATGAAAVQDNLRGLPFA
ncbi:unnamed protein product [Dibothriocephalus latus]|uniref:Uncharacterized protein n=1 Tax=Dibothriocephalus latus TaxID=60516 RepID=A0A3P7PWS3_DIBLA|nr:unnamed protein product [Dibothriocephalus latus]